MENELYSTDTPVIPPDHQSDESWHGINHSNSWKEMNGTSPWKEPNEIYTSFREYAEGKTKALRRKISHLTSGILIYLFLANLVGIILVGIFEESLDDGLYLLLAFGPAVLSAILFMRRRDKSVKELFRVKQHLTLGTYFQLLCVFMMGQLIFVIFDWIIEYLLNFVGLSAADAVASATASSTTIPMMIYAGFGAPLFEEFLYRGFVMKNLEDHSKVFAILVSSILFGFMHGNFAQIPFAFVVGLTLGYTAMEYSLGAAILLHFTNNFIFGDVLSRVLSIFDRRTSAYIFSSLMIFLFIAGVLVLLYHREDLKNYLQKNRIQQGQIKALLTSIPFWIFIIFTSLEALASLTLM